MEVAEPDATLALAGDDADAHAVAQGVLVCESMTSFTQRTTSRHPTSSGKQPVLRAYALGGQHRT